MEANAESEGEGKGKKKSKCRSGRYATKAAGLASSFLTRPKFLRPPSACQLHMRENRKNKPQSSHVRTYSVCNRSRFRTTEGRGGWVMREAARNQVLARERLSLSLLFPQISSQVSNLPFAGSRHLTNNSRDVSIHDEPGICQSRWRGSSPFGRRVRGCICAGLNSLARSLTLNSPQLNSQSQSCWPPLEIDRASRPRVDKQISTHLIIKQYIHIGPPLFDRNSTNQGSQEAVDCPRSR